MKTNLQVIFYSCLVFAMAACSSSPSTGLSGDRVGASNKEINDKSMPPATGYSGVPVEDLDVVVKQPGRPVSSQSVPVDSLNVNASGGYDVSAAECQKRETTLLFDFNSDVIKEMYRPVLLKQAKCLNGVDKGYRVVIQGNTDERGSREYNLALGQRRAEVVKKQLNFLGVDDPRLEAVSFGEERPVAQGKDEESYAKNRRVEIIRMGR